MSKETYFTLAKQTSQVRARAGWLEPETEFSQQQSCVLRCSPCCYWCPVVPSSLPATNGKWGRRRRRRRRRNQLVDDQAQVSPADLPILRVGIECTLTQLLDKGFLHAVSQPASQPASRPVFSSFLFKCGVGREARSGRVRCPSSGAATPRRSLNLRSLRGLESARFCSIRSTLVWVFCLPCHARGPALSPAWWWGSPSASLRRRPSVRFAPPRLPRCRLFGPGSPRWQPAQDPGQAPGLPGEQMG